MEEVETCDTGLVLGIGPLGCGGLGSTKQKRNRQQKPPVQFHLLFPPGSDSVEEEQEVEGSSSKVTDEGEDWNRGGNNQQNHHKRKLRLTKEQSSLLEHSFKEHSTLSPIEKQELAKKLSLRPRQVEVWFQNRRARTKLKQIEVDCEFLKKWCESLRDENRRLKMELQELRSVKLGSPFYIHLQKAAANAVTMCPSCERVVMKEGEIAKKEHLLQ